ncbi:hypothetical protein ACFX5D_00450 [Flavobacterium sp. LB3P45]|uniref:Uncharacterized protein n=1 Tax=Flavobacterium fructosi TaxID=3230416 RepID=A0ABW6HHD6_9FLAO
MKKIKLFIDKNPEFIYIIIGVIAFAVIGIIYDNLEIMFKVFLGVVLFGVLIGLISYLIKIFSK